MNESPLEKILQEDGGGLVAFIFHARKNQDAFFDQCPEAMRLLAEVEDIFQRFRSVLNNNESAALVVLAVRCHSLYITAASAAMSGSTMEVHPLLRAALECAGYAAHLRLNPELERMWSSRADRADETARKAVRDNFGHRKIQKSVVKLNPSIGTSYDEMYDASIDLGAHPNVIGVMSSFRVQEQEDGRTIEHHILTSDLAKILHTAAFVGQVGVLCAYILRSVFPAVAVHMADDIFIPPVQRLKELSARIAELARSKTTS